MKVVNVVGTPLPTTIQHGGASASPAWVRTTALIVLLVAAAIAGGAVAYVSSPRSDAAVRDVDCRARLELTQKAARRIAIHNLKLRKAFKPPRAARRGA